MKSCWLCGLEIEDLVCRCFVLAGACRGFCRNKFPLAEIDVPCAFSRLIRVHHLGVRDAAWWRSLVVFRVCARILSCEVVVPPLGDIVTGRVRRWQLELRFLCFKALRLAALLCSESRHLFCRLVVLACSKFATGNHAVSLNTAAKSIFSAWLA